MEDDIALDTLEDRIKKLELTVVSNIPLDEINISKVKPILNSLHEVDTVLISTLSGHEKITFLLKQVYILEKLLDPSFLESNFNLDSKVESILESEKDILSYVNNLSRVKELEPVLNNNIFENLMSYNGRINKLSTDLLKCKEDCDKQTAEVIHLVKEYKESILYVSNLFVELETLITKLEIKNQPGKIME